MKTKYQDDRFKHSNIDNKTACKQSKYSNKKAENVRLDANRMSDYMPLKRNTLQNKDTNRLK